MATQEQILGALRRHAILSVSIERAAAMGQPIPREVAMEVQRIEADINSILPASAAQAVAQFQEQVKSDLLRMEGNAYGQALGEQRVLARGKLDALRDRGAKNVTRSINDGNDNTGLTYAQMQSALAKGKFTTRPPLHARDVYRAEVAHESGGQIDPDKFRKAWTKAFDAPAGSPTRERFLDRIGADRMDKADRTKFFNQLSTEMLADEMNMRRDDRALEADKNAFMPKVHEVSARDQTRLDVTAALLKEVPRQPKLAENMMDRVSDRSLNDRSGTGMRSDVAQAMAAHTGQHTPDEMAADHAATVEAATSETLL
jgi:hypothetical protein